MQKHYYSLLVIGLCISSYGYLHDPRWVNLISVGIMSMSIITSVFKDTKRERNWGIVISKESHKPMVGITLILYRKTKTRNDFYASTKTDRRGRYQLIPENGTYLLKAIDKGGLPLAEQEVVVTDQEPKINKKFKINPLKP